MAVWTELCADCLTVVGEVDGVGEVEPFYEGHGFLEVVFGFAADAEGVALDLRVDLDLAVFDLFVEGFGLFGGDALFEGEFLFDDFSGFFGVGELHHLGVDLFFDHFAEDDVFDLVEAEFGVGGHGDLFAVELDFGGGAFEVVAVHEFFVGDVEGVFDDVEVDFGDDVEGEIGGHADVDTRTMGKGVDTR